MSNLSAVERDAAFKRFDLTFDSRAVASKLLIAVNSTDAHASKSVVRATHVAGWLDEEQCETAPQMTGDSELTPRLSRGFGG